MGDVGNGGGYSPVQARGTWDISVSSSQFFCEPKTALKINKFLKSGASSPNFRRQEEIVKYGIE